MSRSYRIEAYSTSWHSTCFTDWLIKNVANDDLLYKIEQADDKAEKLVYRCSPGVIDQIATIQKGWWGKWDIKWTEQGAMAVSPSWGGGVCNFEHGGVMYFWSSYSKLFQSNNREQVARIYWTDSWNGVMDVTEGGQGILDVIVSTAMAAKCHWQPPIPQRVNS
jgi:hypothetical protein